MRIAYIVPTSTLSTFIYNEMIEVLGAGHELVVVPLHSTRESKVALRTCDGLKPDKTLPASLCNATIICLSLYMLFTHPVRVLLTLFSLHWAAGLNPFVHAGVLAVTPKALAAAWWLSRLRVDRIHAHFASHTATCAGIASTVSRIPFSFTAHAYDIFCTSITLHNGTLNWKLRHAIQVFTISEYGKKLLRARLPAPDRNRVHRVYVGIPMDLFQEQAPPPIKSEFRLLCIAYFDRKKGLDTLLDACALLKCQSFPFHLHLYGQGPLREDLVTQIARLDLEQHVTLGVPIQQEEVARQLAACHVFVMPCRKDPKTGNIDGIPTVFMEAMATGRPVISCPLSGIPELVRHCETGLLVEPDNPAALAEAVTRLFKENPLRIYLGRQASSLARKQHDQRTNTRLLLDLMTNVGSVPSYFVRTVKQYGTEDEYS
jgi:colanic acid/amylovoran biosynthesis glycosyltransferase